MTVTVTPSNRFHANAMRNAAHRPGSDRPFLAHILDTAINAESFPNSYKSELVELATRLLVECTADSPSECDFVAFDDACEAIVPWVGNPHRFA